MEIYNPESVLFLFPVPISENPNRTGIPLENLEILKSTSLFFVEKVKTARRYIAGLKLGLDINKMIFYGLMPEDTDFLKIPACIELLKNHKRAILMSEAGCPGIADPGAGLILACHKAGIKVIPLSGPSSILLTLMASGQNGQQFTFHGYLPIDKEKRKKHIKQLEYTALKTGFAQIFMETPYRNQSLLDVVLKEISPTFLLSIGYDITSNQEFIQTKTIAQWQKESIKLAKAPAIFILGK